MSDEKNYRVGVLGASFGGSVHVPAFHAQGRFDVVAIASPNRAAEVAKMRNIPHSFSSLEEMLAGVELDVLSVATPPFEHREPVLRALERGLHVLCEKPFGLNVAEAEEMLEASKRAGTVCALAHEFRYLASRIATRELFVNGHLGRLRALEVSWSGPMLRTESGRPNSWWFERRRGGGVTGAILSHNIDAASHFIGRPPVRATGYERTAIPERTSEGQNFTSDVADGAFATVDYGDGLIATITVDATRIVSSVLLAAHGSLRTAVSSGTDLGELRTFAIDAEETSELEIVPQPHDNLRAAHGNLPAFVTLLDAFAARIDGGTAEIPTFEDGLHTQRVLAAVGYSTPTPTSLSK
jgi:predicted dehydrogenase